MTSETKLREVAEKTTRMLNDRNAASEMGLFISSEAWGAGKVDLLVRNRIPHEMTPRQAKELGWALYMLGKYGLELAEDEEHEIPDEEFFAG